MPRGIWVSGKIAYKYLPTGTPRPTLTARLAQPKQPTYLPPPLRPMCMVKWYPLQTSMIKYVNHPYLPLVGKGCRSWI